MENWKDVLGYEGTYQVSDLGNVRSLDRVDSKRKGRILKPTSDGRRYLHVCLSLNGKQTTKKVHQLVAVAFLNHKPCGYKLVIDHIDNDTFNNKLENLQLISQRENSSKDRKGGTSKYAGVCLSLRENKFRATCHHNGKKVHLGYFNTELEASEVYNNFLNSIR